MVKIKLFFAVLFTILTVLPSRALGNSQSSTSYSISPSSGIFTVGSTVKTSLVLNAPQSPINAGEVTLHFPGHLLTPTIITKGNIFSFWQTSPTISGDSIHFVGGRLGGFTGIGNVFTVNFRIKQEGRAVLSLSKAQILAADGEGTNVLEGVYGAEWNLVPGKAAPPPLPTISSSTHPNQDIWYSNNLPELQWMVPGNTQTISYNISQKSDTDPEQEKEVVNTYSPKEPLADGIWYFHLKYKNEQGWGPVAHFQLHIDTTPPTVDNITLLDGNQTIQRHPLISLRASDTLSGIQNFSLSINKGPETSLTQIEGTTYELPFLTPGEKEAIFTISDNAGNKTKVKKVFEITEQTPGKIKIVEKNKNFIPLYIWWILLLLFIIILLLIIWGTRRKKKEKEELPPDNHDDPPMYEVT